MPLGNRTMLNKTNITFFLSILFSAFIGTVCYQFNILNLGDHYDKFASKDDDIINGIVPILAFQQRVIPSIVEKFISFLSGKDLIYSTMINHKILFILISVSFFIYASKCAGLDNCKSIMMVLIFSIVNVFVIDSGYWLCSFDLYNELFLIMFFIIVFSKLERKIKILLTLIISIPWIFIFEEVVYVPVFAAFFINSERIRKLDIKSMVYDYRNYALVGIAFAIMKLINLIRSYFSIIPYHHPHVRVLFEQWLMVYPNIRTIAYEFYGFFYFRNVLRNGFYWAQSGAIFIILFFVVTYTVKTYKKISHINFAFIILIYFMFIITFLFAHLEETNTMMPLVASMFVLLANKSAEELTTENPKELKTLSNSL